MRDFVVDTPIPNIVATLEGGELTVTLDATGQTWEGECASLVGQRVRELGGITLAITTAADPHQMQAGEEFVALMQSGQVAMGWVTLAGTDRSLSVAQAQAWALSQINFPEDGLRNPGRTTSWQ